MTIFIIGGGAAGFFSAIHNKQNHPDQDVIIIEKSSQILSKVKISGGGRCNVTHGCFDPKQLCEFYPRGGKELRGPFHTFGPQETMAWFESHGVPLKIEADNRVFPESDTSLSIINCLFKTAEKLGIKIWTECKVKQIRKEKEGFCLTLANNQTHIAQKLILATGSSPAGYKFAKELGHTIDPLVPSLFTLKVNDPQLHQRTGLSVENTEVWVTGNKKQAQSGPLLITHWGLSGPSIIKLSAWKAIDLFQANYKTTIHINWLSSYIADEVEQKINTYKTQHAQKSISKQSPFKEIPKRLWEYLVQKSKIPEKHTWKQLSPPQQTTLLQTLTEGQFQTTGKSPFKEEFVTCGGVNLKEINFKTMASKCCPGLHIIGELLNIDGVTGGFNFQNAWTTGYLSSL